MSIAVILALVVRPSPEDGFSLSYFVATFTPDQVCRRSQTLAEVAVSEAVVVAGVIAVALHRLHIRLLQLLRRRCREWWFDVALADATRGGQTGTHAISADLPSGVRLRHEPSAR